MCPRTWRAPSADLFGRPTDQPNSYVLSALGAIGVVFLLLLVVNARPDSAKESSISQATVFFTVGFALQFALMMAYFWGSSRIRSSGG